MRLAVISDIHGNLEALKQVLADIEKREVDAVCCAGDIVGYGPFPNEVIQLLQGRNIPSVMGNYDDTIGNSRMVCGCDYKDEEAALMGAFSVQWTSENVTAENKLYLKQLPFEVDMGTENASIRIVHGSPRKFNEYLHENLTDKEVNNILMECTADVLVCGHTHIPFIRSVGGKLVVNAGSVGKPIHGDPRSTYAIIEVNSKNTAEIIFVEYDAASTGKAMAERGMPEVLIDIIRTGKS